MAKMCVARSTSVAGERLAAQSLMSTLPRSQTSTACMLGGCPRTACTPAEATSMSLRLPSSRRKSPSAMGLRQIFPVQTKRTLFTRCAPRDPAGSGQVRSHKISLTRLGLFERRMRQAWKKLRYRLEYIGLLMAAKSCTALSPLRHLGAGQDLRCRRSIVDVPGRRVALANLNAFPGKYSAPEKRRIVRESYQHFAQTMLDLMWSPRLTPKNFLRYIEFEGFPETASNQGGIVVCYHYSNFEWLEFGFRVSGSSQHHHRSGIQEPVARSNFPTLARAAPAMSSARVRGDSSPFQNSASWREHRDAD